MNARLEDAALTTARALGEIFRSLERGLKAMRRNEFHEALNGDYPLAPVRPSVGGWFDPRCLDSCVREGARIRFGLYLLRRSGGDWP